MVFKTKDFHSFKAISFHGICHIMVKTVIKNNVENENRRMTYCSCFT